MTQKSKTGFFAGSFNPFTIGHKSIAERALTVADRLVIAVGYNPAKADADDTEQRVANIAKIFAADARVSVIAYSGLTVEAARRAGADFLVRGVRSVADFEFERNLADANRKISGLETVLITALPEHSYISSSMVRELDANGFDTSQFLP